MPEPSEAPQEEALEGAEGIKEAVAEKSEAAGSVIETIDGIAFKAGSFSISLWDVLIVAADILGVVVFAWLGSKLGPFRSLG